MTLRVVVLAAAVAAIIAPGAAFADAASAGACAQKLAPDARQIYDATAPQVTPGVDLKSVVTTATKKLAMAGTISRGDARSSAMSAVQCLQQLQK
ncbi:hypothetical protein SAMN02745172_01357 [Pseudoxanthobacter soli DSM 19599]|uniref:UrcA family protein n=1 Tax=Pseudoxanthobacter soli DSM 19599 TaxID=1123029 RepID=A0A1M7ZEU5_9HYPH|nr:hypothetical protein [Pseudoxanthobacter soli]SHO63362.1 hypothetical protein SAMN02745172_01357 [Pseudoxanthobacter soli DSM 19599]